ncbi:MAG: 3,4-dihydroxy-2-butanone-4-phosphate synthase [Myxococcales bacterium]|nr:3,4-dihydroxy-2-butanone-4-phosphate synthase [Myxococcales bacterium]
MAKIASIARAIDDIKNGKMVILVDDEDRENEGDLVIAADKTTPEAIAFMVEHGRGLICLAMDDALIDRLGVAPMSVSNQAPLSTAFTESIDAVACAGSGVSATDRSTTILTAIADGATSEDFRVPGHIFPLRARRGGVIVRSGQTEGSVDLSRLAGLSPAGVICEVMAEDGTMSRLDALVEFGERYDLPVVTVADLIEYRLHSEPLVAQEARSRLPTQWGTFDLVVFRSLLDDALHVALTMGDIKADEPTLVRVQRANLLGDAFGLATARGRPNLAAAMAQIAEVGTGAVVYLAAEEGAPALAAQLGRYVQRARGEVFPSPEEQRQAMDFKEFGVGAQILRELGLGKIRIMTNSPKRMRAVSGFGLEIVEWLPLGEPSATVAEAIGGAR